MVKGPPFIFFPYLARNDFSTKVWSSSKEFFQADLDIHPQVDETPRTIYKSMPKKGLCVLFFWKVISL